MSKRKTDEREANATEDWRPSVKQMSTEREQYQYMLEHDVLTDCTFVVGPEDGETREFKAHKVHIARVSFVFEAMLLSGEMSDAQTEHLRVTDLSPHTFQLLLSSMYGKKPETKSYQEAENLAFAADKYQMKALLEICVSQMAALISPANIWTALETADLLRNKRFKKTCVEVLQCDTLRCITNPAFMQASEENVVLLLEQDELNVDDESALVNGIMHWARHAARQRGLSDDDSGVRAVLEPRLLSLFRLLAMTPQQFMLGPGLAGWLTSDEKAVISECLQFKVFCKMPEPLSSATEKRKNKTFGTAIAMKMKRQRPSDYLICKREIIDSRPDVQQTYETCCICHTWFDCHSNYRCVHAMLIFRAKLDCKLLGFQCASRCRSNPVKDPTPFSCRKYEEDIRAMVYRFGDTLSNDCDGNEVQRRSFGHDVEFDSSISILFKEAVPLVPGAWFGIQVVYCYDDTDLPAGEYPNPARARSVRTTAGVQFEFRTEELEGYRTSENDGIIESLIFSL